MLAFALLPALLGLVLIVDYISDDDDSETPNALPDEPVQVADDIAEFRGTTGADTITAREAGGTIRSGGGDDLVIGSDTAIDLVFGGDGNDQVSTGGGDDEVHGGAGNDLLEGGSGNDNLLGNDGQDTLYGGAGNDLVRGQEGDDQVFGGDGDDTISGNYGNDYVDMGDGDDTSQLYGYASQGDDTVLGGAGNDTLIEGEGRDVLDGGAGDDLIRAIDGHNPVFQRNLIGADDVFGGAGNDTLQIDDGDIVIGGAGEDLFHIQRSYIGLQNAVDIRDFDTAEDTLLVEYDDESMGDVAVVFDTETETVQITIGSEAVATLAGLTAADVPDIEFAVLTTGFRN